MKKALLAFSGGLDTTFCMPYLQEKGYEVTTITVNTGGFTKEELEKIEAKSKKLGAVEHIFIDAVDEFYEDFVKKVVWANYLRGGSYPACVGPERVVAAKTIAEVAKEKGIHTVVHGSTGAGNDQIRFDLCLRAILPEVEIIAPIRDEQLTRAQEVEYLKERGIEVDVGAKDYSVNVGVLGTTIGGKETGTTESLPPDDVFPFVKPLKECGDGVKMTLKFEKGEVVEVNGEAIVGVPMIQKIRKIAEDNGVGKGSHLGTTILGIKGRIVFEAAAMKVIIAAHTELEKSVLTSKQVFWKNHLGTVWGDMVHEGLYFDPVITDIEAMMQSSQETVSGEVYINLVKGNVYLIGSKSKFSLMDSSIASYGEENAFWDGRDAQGFAKIYGLEGVIANHKRK